jgi:hypothetical protein
MTGNIAKDDEALAEIDRLDAERNAWTGWSIANLCCDDCEFRRQSGETDDELLERVRTAALAILAEADEDALRVVTDSSAQQRPL